MAKTKGKEVQGSRGNDAREDQQAIVLTRSRAQSSGADRSDQEDPNRIGGADLNRVEGTDPIRSDEVEGTHSLHPNRPDQAAVNRSEPK